MRARISPVAAVLLSCLIVAVACSSGGKGSAASSSASTTSTRASSTSSSAASSSSSSSSASATSSGASASTTASGIPPTSGSAVPGAQGATLGTFAGTWTNGVGSVEVSAEGLVEEKVNNSSGQPVISVRLALSQPRGSAQIAAADLVVVSVETWNDPTRTAPAVGATGVATVARGVWSESFTELSFCNAQAAPGACGG